jgi:hypothetical protein
MRTTTFRSTTRNLWWCFGGPLAVSFISLTCGSGSNSGGGQSQGGPVPQDQLGDRVTVALCAGLKECCQSRVWAFNAAHCDAAARQSATLFVGHSGTCPPKTTYDAEAAGECVQQMQSILASCGDLGTFPPAICDLLCKGTQPIGGACSLDKECVQPATGQIACDLSTGRGICTLVPRGKLGDACAFTCGSQSCGLPTTRSPEPDCYRDDGLYCCARDWTCHQLAPLGGDCSKLGWCDTGAYCNTAGVCEAKKPAGAPCTGNSSDECRGGYCDSTYNACVQSGGLNVTAQVCAGGA